MIISSKQNVVKNIHLISNEVENSKCCIKVCDEGENIKCCIKGCNKEKTVSVV